MRRSVAFTLLASGFCSVAWGAEAPVTVSPGHASKLALIGDACPTFNWGAVPGAKSYELVVYRLSEEREEAQPVLSHRISGSALGWTPALDQCLERGGQYAWSVRALGRKGAPDWSPPRLFEVASGPSKAEFGEALAVVQAYLETEGARTESWVRGSTSPVPIGFGEEALAPEASGASGGVPEPQALTTPDTTGLRSEVADTTGVTFGVHGISNSMTDGSVGVVGQSTATSGSTVGVLGEVASDSGAAGEFHVDIPPGGSAAVLRGFRQGDEVFTVLPNGDVFVGDHLWLGQHLADPKMILFNPSGTENLQWNQSIGQFELSDDLFLDGVLGFTESNLLSWDAGEFRFELTGDLQTNGNIVAGTTGDVGFNAFGGTNKSQADITSDGDVYVEDDLEVDGVLHADGGYGCGTYKIVTVCVMGNVHLGPNCDDVPVGSLCESNGECGLSATLDNCGTNDWYFRDG